MDVILQLVITNDGDLLVIESFSAECKHNNVNYTINDMDFKMI